MREWFCPSRPGGLEAKCELDAREAVCRWCNREMPTAVDLAARVQRLERLLSRVRGYRVLDERFERQSGLELDIDDALAGRPERPALHQVSWCCRCMQRTHRCTCQR